MKGSDLINLKVSSNTARGRADPVVTALSESKSGGEGKKTAGKVAGGATGTIISASGQTHLKAQANTRLDFQFAADSKCSKSEPTGGS